MARSNRDIAEVLAPQWLREAYDRERMAERPDYSDHERRVLRAQANVYRVCATALRNEGTKVARG